MLKQDDRTRAHSQLSTQKCCEKAGEKSRHYQTYLWCTDIPWKDQNYWAHWALGRGPLWPFLACTLSKSTFLLLVFFITLRFQSRVNPLVLSEPQKWPPPSNFNTPVTDFLNFLLNVRMFLSSFVNMIVLCLVRDSQSLCFPDLSWYNCWWKQE